MIKKAVLAGLICLLAAKARALELDDRAIRYDVRLEEDSRGPLNPSFMERFDSAFHSRIDRTYYDRLQPLHNAFAEIAYSGNVDRLNDHYAGLAMGALRRSFTKSLQEAAVETPFITGLLSWVEDRQVWVARLFRGSLNNVEERDLNPLANTPSESEGHWQRQLERSGGLGYGIRPSLNPYAYVSWLIGPRKNPILEGDCRYQFVHFRSHRFEGLIRLPIESVVSLRVGMRYEVGSRDPVQAVFRAEKRFKEGNLFVSFYGRQDTQILIGFSRAW